MKLSNILFAVVFIIAGFSSTMWLVGKSNYEKKIESQHEKMSNTETSFINSVYLNASNVVLKDRNLAINDLDSIRLRSIFVDNLPKLVVRFKESQCSDCIDSVLANISKITEGIDPESIIVMPSYNQTGEVLKLFKHKKLPYKVYNSTEDILDKNLENSGNPSLFLLDSTLSLSATFMVNSNYWRTTRLYLNTIKKYLSTRYHAKFPITMEKTSAMDFKKSTFNLGHIKYGMKAQASAEFTNTGKTPLVITSVVTGCGCTVASYSRSMIPTGGKSTITINYDSKRTGSFDRQIQVYSNAVESPVTLRIAGVIDEETKK